MISHFEKTFTLAEKILYPLAGLLFVFLLDHSLAYFYKIREYDGLAEIDTLFSSNYSSVYNQPDIIPLIRDKAYKEALIQLARKDSIHLSVNLTDSTVCLYIKGVKIHQTDIKHFKIDKILGKMPNRLYTWIFSHSLDIKSCYSTIVKEPIVIRQAPKDTLEAALNIWQPDTLIQNPAFLQLGIDHGIRIIFEQDVNSTLLDKWVKFKFYFHIRTGKSLRALHNFLFLRKQEYQPSVTIKIPANDLRAIYRALPSRASLVFRY